jgi:hypothetical protein
MLVACHSGNPRGGFADNHDQMGERVLQHLISFDFCLRLSLGESQCRLGGLAHVPESVRVV